MHEVHIRRTILSCVCAVRRCEALPKKYKFIIHLETSLQPGFTKLSLSVHSIETHCRIMADDLYGNAKESPVAIMTANTEGAQMRLHVYREICKVFVLLGIVWIMHLSQSCKAPQMLCWHPRPAHSTHG